MSKPVPSRLSKKRLFFWSIDGVLGIRTQGGRIEGTDDSTELRRHPKKRLLLLLYKPLLYFLLRGNSMLLLAGFDSVRLEQKVAQSFVKVPKIAQSGHTIGRLWLCEVAWRNVKKSVKTFRTRQLKLTHRKKLKKYNVNLFSSMKNEYLLFGVKLWLIVINFNRFLYETK